MNFVLTGHKGLIGTSLLERLQSQGDKCVGLVDIRANCSIDIRNLHLVEPVEHADILYHLASFCKIRDCIKNPAMAFEHNVRGTYSVMQFCAKHKIPKIMFTSSTRVLYPEKNPYTASKLYGEELVKSYGMEYVIVRPSTVYGPFDDLTKRVTHQFIMAALKNEDLIIFGDRTKVLDFTYIDDFINAFMQASTTTNRTFNIGTGHGQNLTDVAQLIINIIGSKSQIVYRPPEKLQPQHVVIDNTDFQCPTSVETGMTKTIEFWLNKNEKKGL